MSFRPVARRRWRRVLIRVSIVLAVVCVLIAGAAVWLVRSLPEIVIAEIGRLTNTRVESQTLDFRFNGSVSLGGLAIRPLHMDPLHDSAILRAGEVHARFCRRSLVRFSPRLLELDIEDFVFDVQTDLDTGRWNVDALRFNRPPEGTGGGIPTIRLTNGRLRYCRISGGKSEVVMVVPVEANLEASPFFMGCSFEIRTSTQSGGYGESRLTGTWRPGELTLTGGLSSTDLPSLERAWAVDVLAAEIRYDAGGDYTLKLNLQGLHGKQTPEVGALRLMAPAEAVESGPLAGLLRFLDQYRPTGTVGSISLRAAGNLERLQDSEVIGTLVCKDISICGVHFPYQIDHLAGELEFTQSGMVMRRLEGKHGPVDVQIEGWTRGSGAERQYQYKITSDNMILDETLYAALRPEQKVLWDLFRPTGTIGVDYRLTRTSPFDARMYVSVELKGVAAGFRDFPYPLTDLTGGLYFDRDSISATNIRSVSGGRQIRLSARVSGRAAGEPIYHISIDANDIPLDATLEKALPERYRELYAQLEADGTANVQASVFSTGDESSVRDTGFFAAVAFQGNSLRLDQFPVALSDVTAEIAVTPDSLSIKRIDGLYGQSRVTVTGAMRMGGDRKTGQYHARVTAREVPVDEATIGLLPKPLAEQVAAFRPEGNVDLTLELRKIEEDESPRYTAHVDCLGVRVNHERLPYPLRDLRGTISLTGNDLVVENVTASPLGGEPGAEGDDAEAPASGTLRIDGSAVLASGGLAEGAFTLTAQDLLFTEELGQALPKSLADLYRELAPRGPFDLDVPALAISRAGPEETVVEFEGRTSLKTCAVQVAGAPMELSGTVSTEGSYSTRQGLTRGRTSLAADQLTVKGKTVTDLTLDAVYDPNARTWSAEHFLGDFYGGRVLGSLEVGGGEEGAARYLVRTSLNRVDLQQFLQPGTTGVRGQERLSPSGSRGRMNASLTVGGRIGDGASRRGVCQVDIMNMQVGRVSSLGQLVSVLSLGEPSDYTFERMLIDSYIKQDVLLIRKLDLSGRNAAFTGSGTMMLRTGDLNLMLTSRGQRVAAEEPSVLRSLTEGLSGAVVRIEVTGTIDDPRVETKKLPIIEDSLRILGTPE